MGELKKFLIRLRTKKLLFDEIYRIELDKEKHVQELFPAFAIEDKQVISDIAEQKTFEQINKEMNDAIDKDLGDALG